MSHITRKHVFGVCVRVRLIPACSATETSYSLGSFDLASIGILSRQQKTKAQIGLRRVQADWVFVVRIWLKQVFLWRGSNIFLSDCYISKIICFSSWHNKDVSLMWRDSHGYKDQAQRWQTAICFNIWCSDLGERQKICGKFCLLYMYLEFMI